MMEEVLPGFRCHPRDTEVRKDVPSHHEDTEDGERNDRDNNSPQRSQLGQFLVLRCAHGMARIALRAPDHERVTKRLNRFRQSHGVGLRLIEGKLRGFRTVVHVGGNYAFGLLEGPFNEARARGAVHAFQLECLMDAHRRNGCFAAWFPAGCVSIDTTKERAVSQAIVQFIDKSAACMTSIKPGEALNSTSRLLSPNK